LRDTRAVATYLPRSSAEALHRAFKEVAEVVKIRTSEPKLEHIAVVKTRP
jgi:hypothetical protein